MTKIMKYIMILTINAHKIELNVLKEVGRALAALCHGSLAARRPLPQLRAALQSAVATEPSAADTVELLGAAGERHA